MVISCAMLYAGKFFPFTTGLTGAFCLRNFIVACRLGTRRCILLYFQFSSFLYDVLFSKFVFTCFLILVSGAGV
jgi:hypothetical protein